MEAESPAGPAGRAVQRAALPGAPPVISVALPPPGAGYRMAGTQGRRGL